MFEQSLLNINGKTRKARSMALALFGQIAVILGLLLVPVNWPSTISPGSDRKVDLGSAFGSIRAAATARDTYTAISARTEVRRQSIYATRSATHPAAHHHR